MATTVAPRRSLPNFEVRQPGWLERQPTALVTGGVLAVLTVLSVFLRSRYISGQFWMDEALSVGISSHSLSSIPGVLRHDGSPPLYYLALHVWTALFGSGDVAARALSRALFACFPTRRIRSLPLV